MAERLGSICFIPADRKAGSPEAWRASEAGVAGWLGKSSVLELGYLFVYSTRLRETLAATHIGRLHLPVMKRRISQRAGISIHAVSSALKPSSARIDSRMRNF